MNKRMMQIPNSNTEVIIVGAGVAGAALAYALGKDGRRVHVIERDLMEPKRMVGELLQPGGYLKLVDLGLEDSVAGIDAQQVFGYAICHDNRHIQIPYPIHACNSNVRGTSFHNGRFVQRLRNIAASLPNVYFDQGTVKSLLKENGIVKGVEYKTRSGHEIIAYASLTVVSDGCYSHLRDTLCSSKVQMISYLFGWTMERNHNFPNSNYGQIILADSSVVLIYPISSTESRCFIEFLGKKIPSLQNGEMLNYLASVVASQIPAELRRAFISSLDKGTIAKVPSWNMSARYYEVPGAILVGDALDMRHPFIAGGMMVALSDVVVLRDLIRPLNDLNDAHAVSRHLQAFYNMRKPMADTVNIVARVVRRVLHAPPEPTSMELRRACFDCLYRSPTTSSDVLVFISGLDTGRRKMIRVFCSIAVGTVTQLLLPFPSPRRMMAIARTLMVIEPAATLEYTLNLTV